MPITYDVPSNRITVTGYTSGSPCTFDNIYDANVAGSWGVVTKTDLEGYDIFLINALLSIGDGSTATYLASYMEHIHFYGDRWFTVKNNATFTCGRTSGTKAYDGSIIAIGRRSSANNGITLSESGAITNFYDTIISTSGAPWGQIYLHGAGVWKDFCLYNNVNYDQVIASNASLVIDGFIYQGCQLSGGSWTTAPQNMRIYASSFKVGANSTTRATDIYGQLTANGWATETDYFIDGSDQSVSLGYGTIYLYIQYSFDLKVQDKDGSPISGATVTIVDVDGEAVSGSPFTTDENGEIPTQALTKDLWYQEQPMGETGPDTQVSKTPHTITISKAGYETSTIKYTIDRKREDIETLLSITVADGDLIGIPIIRKS